MLLYWGTLEPAGQSQVAALRFAQPVHVHSIRIFPKDVKPFNKAQDIISETEPESFKLEVLFNAQLTSSAPGEAKQKATNMLVPTTIAYVGEPVAFDVPMGTGWSTRILILTGKFEKLSLAVYGETAVDQPVEPATYHSNQLPFIEPTPISTSLDPAVDRDPTGLAYALLTLIPDAPPLPLIIRLMFTLKPANDDWDLPDFPYIHPNLEEDGEFDMQMAAQLANRPVSDETAYGSLRAFADRIASAVRPKSVDQAYDTANLLARVAPQHPDLARLIVDRLNFRSIFDASTVEDDTLSRLLVAASNPDIARALSEAQIADYLRPEHKARLSFRIEGWSILSDALWNTQADFDTARKFLLEVGTDEASFGVVLHALIQHSDLSDRLAENSVLPDTSLVADPEQEIGSHDEFIAYLRAWLGVACVLSVYAWADSLPVVRGRERALGILNVWQGYKGYREIVNHLMLTRQMLFRLDCMMDDEEPSRSGVLAERILLALSRFPTSFKSQYLVKTILGLPSGLTVIDDEERLALRDLAYLTDDGLPGAIQEVSSPPERPISPRNLLALRVALVIIAKELRKGGDGELAALRTLWEQDGHGLALYLAESLSVLSADLTTYFSTSPPPSGPLEHIGNLFNAANELMRELQELVPAYRLPGRALRALVVALCDVFACADAADFRFSPGSEASTAAQRSRRRSIDLTRLLVLTKDGKLFTYAETTFRTLLRHASEPGNRDPAYHVTQVLGLIDYLLPMPQEAAMAIDQEELALNWVTPILPRVLTDLTAFFRILDPDSRAHFLLRIADIDDGQVGVGEWLLLDELKRLQSAAEAASSASDTVSVLRQYEMTISLKLLYGIFVTHTPCASRLLEYAAGTLEPVAMMTSALNTLLSKRLFSPLLVEVAEHLLDLWSDSFNTSLRFALALVFLRGVQQPDSSTSRSSLLKSALIALEDVPVRFVDPERLCNEVRDTLLILSMSPESSSDAVAWSTVMVVNWLIKQSHAGLPQLSTLRGISMDTLGALFDRFAERLDADAYARLEHIRSTITTPDEDVQVQPSTLLPDTLELPLSDLDAVLRSGIPPPLTPKRTTPPHAQSVFSLVTVSPPTALLRSPAVTGLTKTYNANDFRTLRQTPSARQNTSRLPSRHVDDFEMVSPQMLPEGLPVPPQFVAGDGAFGGLAPPFGGM